MIEPYNTVGLIPTFWGIRRRDDIKHNIEHLKSLTKAAQVTNWMKDIRAELAQIIYEQPVYPKNRYMKDIPPKHAKYKRDVIDKQVALMQKRGIWAKPSR